MISQSLTGKPGRSRAEAQFKTKKKIDAESEFDTAPARQAEAEKTARLRALRLAKEAVDKEAAIRDAAAAKLAKSAPRRRVPGLQAQNPAEAE
jgi:hypothetical protein